MTPPSVTVIVTVLNDRRVTRTLDCLSEQTLRPMEVIVADGGSTDGTFELAEEYAKKDPTVLPRRYPGTIPESRNGALAAARGDIIAFLDVDEVAPKDWLEKLTAPLSDPKVGFTGGPTPALDGTANGVAAKYYNAYLNRHYDRVARDNPHAIPMGNSAWRSSVFKSLGPLRADFRPREGNEDQEFAIRTLDAGWKGVYVKEAWVSHDYSDMSMSRMLRKQAAYATGGYLVWRTTKRTYEASYARVLPYILPFFFIVIGLIMIPIFLARLIYPEIVLALGGLAFAALFFALLVDGLSNEKEYPGMKLRPVEILRRWATLYGALRGYMRYGINAQASEPASKRTN